MMLALRFAILALFESARASSIAVPFLFLIVGSALACNNVLTMSRCPFRHARWRAVVFLLFMALMSAFNSNRASRESNFPAFATM